MAQESLLTFSLVRWYLSLLCGTQKARGCPSVCLKAAAALAWRPHNTWKDRQHTPKLHWLQHKQLQVCIFSLHFQCWWFQCPVTNNNGGRTTHGRGNSTLRIYTDSKMNTLTSESFVHCYEPVTDSPCKVPSIPMSLINEIINKILKHYTSQLMC